MCSVRASGVNKYNQPMLFAAAALSLVAALSLAAFVSLVAFARLAALSIDGYDVADTRNQSYGLFLLISRYGKNKHVIPLMSCQWDNRAVR